MSKPKKLLAKAIIVRHTLKTLPVLAGGAMVAGKTFVRKIQHEKQKKKGVITMKKSTFISLIVFLSAAAGALAAAYVYLMKRERELDEYEQMLFSEDYEDDMAEELEPGDCDCDCDCGCGCDCAEEAPAPVPEAAE